MKTPTVKTLTQLLAKRLAFVPSWAWDDLDFEITSAELLADLEYGRDEEDDDSDWANAA